jgi:hypothetical protein
MAQALSRRLSPRKPGFNPRPVYVGFVVNKVTLTGFPPSTSLFSCQYNFAIASHSFVKTAM